MNRKMNRNVCAFTAVCGEDKDWVPQYLAEAERLEMPFAVLFDRCEIDEMAAHRLCVTCYYRTPSSGEFQETDKQVLIDAVQAAGYRWAMAWDVDETYEADARRKVGVIAELGWDCVDVRWLNLWGVKEFVRVDRGYAEGHRVKFYNLQGDRRWYFDHPITNGAKLAYPMGPAVVGYLAGLFTCLHWGMLTPALRRLHKERWDRIYSTALRGDPNPYNFWKECVETEDQAVTVRHGYFTPEAT